MSFPSYLPLCYIVPYGHVRHAECDLLINMYEEEFVFPDKLLHVLSIVNRLMKDCDHDEVLVLAEKLRKLIEKAIELETAVGFCF